MKSNPGSYSYIDGVSRIDELLAGADAEYEELDYIPSRDRLSFSNGFYVYCSALFIDLRGSSSISAAYNRPTLSKIYKSYISECVGIVNSISLCSEVMIEGDGIIGIYDTQKKSDIDTVFSIAYQLNSLINILNCRFKRYNINPITAGIGLSYGRALMIKAGYKGSAINEVVWLGDVVNEAAKLCKNGARAYYDYNIMVSSVFHQNLNDQNKSFLSWNSNRNCYHGNVISLGMEDWIKNNCK